MTLALVQPLALSSMLIDHLGAVSILADWSRVVGRAALPAFVVMLALNALATLDPRRLWLRVLLLLMLSQPLWWLSVGSWHQLCIMLTLLAVVSLVWCYRRSLVLEGVIILGAFLLVSPWVEYGPWPLLLVPICLTRSLPALALALVWPLVQYPDSPAFQASAFAALALVWLSLRVPFDVPRLPRLVTRWFYPAHLFLLSASIPLI